MGWRSRCVGLVTAMSMWAMSACAPMGPPSPGSLAPAPPLPDPPWPMHTIAGTYRGANGLGAGDVNGDGFVDYVTNYEFDQRYVLSLHPGAGDVRRSWQQVQVWPVGGGAPPQGTGVNPENSFLADVDGDGNLDILGAQGESQLEFWEGNSPGIRVIFGPPPTQVTDPSKWVDAGRVPATTTFGHLHYVTARDLTGDGLAEIVAGGRLSSTTNDYSGLYWLEAPANPTQRRDLSKYRLHMIDPTLTSGHGHVYDDVDQDGDTDILVANADFDTSEADEAVFWYENPGATSPTLRSPWTRRTIYRSPDFHTKPQIGVGDLDGNGMTDYATMTESEVLWFRKTSVTPVAFDVVTIPKDPAAQWLTRAVRIADVNSDGRLDLIGMLVHQDSVLPQAKAAVFWMEYTGPTPTADNWVTHVIRWGSGDTALIPGFGEKWDQVDLADVDGDGDLDIVANCEEWWMQQPLEVVFYADPGVNPSTQAVVWFENTVGEQPRVWQESSGRVVAEAERATRVDDGAWVSRSNYEGAAGSGYLQLHNAIAPVLDDTLPPQDKTGGIDAVRFPGVHYRVVVAGGNYTMWVRRWAPASWGYGLGAGASDAAWGSVDGGPSFVIDDRGGPFDSWVWQRVAQPLVMSSGVHDLALRQRERGYAVDRILLTTDPTFVPAGVGPPETRS